MFKLPFPAVSAFARVLRSLAVTATPLRTLSPLSLSVSFFALPLLALALPARPVAADQGHVHHHDGAAASRIGVPGDPQRVSRTVAVEMNDSMRFVPSSFDVRRGETIRFVVRNAGRVRHEM